MIIGFQQKILTAFTKIPSLGSCLKARACMADSAVTASLDTLQAEDKPVMQNERENKNQLKTQNEKLQYLQRMRNQ